MGKEYCCPLCERPTNAKMYLFVTYVLSNKKNCEDYMNGKLTFEDWEKINKEAFAE